MSATGGMRLRRYSRLTGDQKVAGWIPDSSWLSVEVSSSEMSHPDGQLAVALRAPLQMLMCGPACSHPDRGVVEGYPGPEEGSAPEESS